MTGCVWALLLTSIDSLLGYKSFVVSDYDKRYDTADYYWGITPNNLISYKAESGRKNPFDFNPCFY